IRDRNVTGVQTCALPISVECSGGTGVSPVWTGETPVPPVLHPAATRSSVRAGGVNPLLLANRGLTPPARQGQTRPAPGWLGEARSEERRVGKGGGGRWGW